VNPNLGMYGIRQFTAVINPPQAAILAVGEAVRQPVVHGDQVAIATTMTLTLSIDHRVVDGAAAAGTAEVRQPCRAPRPGRVRGDDQPDDLRQGDYRQ
jgi:hypothetical protein